MTQEHVDKAKTKKSISKINPIFEYKHARSDLLVALDDYRTSLFGLLQLRDRRIEPSDISQIGIEAEAIDKAWDRWFGIKILEIEFGDY